MGANAFEVTEPTELLKFLFAQMPDRSRSAIKSLLTHRQILVNGQVVTQFNHPLTTGQVVGISGASQKAQGPGRGVKIVFEDAHLIVIEKPAGLLSMATDLEKEKTAYSLLSEHVKKANPRHRIFIIHRLDRETSGLMMFAKNQEVQKLLQAAWQEAVLERIYVAVVEGRVEQPQGTITSWLKENQALIMRSSPTPNDGQKSTTHFRVLKSSALYTLLELQLETGRKNQIRIHMQDLGHSVIGDTKYGATRNPIKRLGLHARVLAFRHPMTGETLRFESATPGEFERLFGGQPNRLPNRAAS